MKQLKKTTEIYRKIYKLSEKIEFANKDKAFEEKVIFSKYKRKYLGIWKSFIRTERQRPLF